jgi:hypothetical protein
MSVNCSRRQQRLLAGRHFFSGSSQCVRQRGWATSTNDASSPLIGQAGAGRVQRRVEHLSSRMLAPHCLLQDEQLQFQCQGEVHAVTLSEKLDEPRERRSLPFQCIVTRAPEIPEIVTY